MDELCLEDLTLLGNWLRLFLSQGIPPTDRATIGIIWITSLIVIEAHYLPYNERMRYVFRHIETYHLYSWRRKNKIFRNAGKGDSIAALLCLRNKETKIKGFSLKHNFRPLRSLPLFLIWRKFNTFLAPLECSNYAGLF